MSTPRSTRAHHASLVTAFVLACAAPAAARRNGIVAPSCESCHGGGDAVVEISASPAAFAPGTDVTFSVRVRRPGGAAPSVGGIYVEKPDTGELRSLTGEGLTSIPGDGFTHAQPKAAAGGEVTFRFGWRAPASPGAVNFDVYALAANGDGRSGGDFGGTARFGAVFGCTEQALYYDADGDGYGSADFDTIVGCAGTTPPAQFAARGGDCNENDAQVHPGAVEKCNQKDDDCDGETDENAEAVELWPDEDGDGYYGAKTGTPVIGCSGIRGYAAEPGDCAPRDPNVHRGATEVCNLIDDNCDGRADERTRPQCGVGFCRAESFTCQPEDCTPSAPQPERCNLLDDDCDGETDEGELCAASEACLAGSCVTSGEPAGGAPAAGGAAPGGAPSSGAGSSAGGASGATAASGASSAPKAASCTIDHSRGRSGWPWLLLAILPLALKRRESLANLARRGTGEIRR